MRQGAVPESSDGRHADKPVAPPRTPAPAGPMAAVSFPASPTAASAIGALLLAGCTPTSAKPSAAPPPSPSAATAKAATAKAATAAARPAAAGSGAAPAPLILEPSAPLANVGTSRLFEWVSLEAGASPMSAGPPAACSDARCGLPTTLGARGDSPVRLRVGAAPSPTAGAGGAPTAGGGGSTGAAASPLLERQISVGAAECVRVAIVTAPRAKAPPTAASALVLLDGEGAVVAEGLSSWVPGDGLGARWTFAPTAAVVCAQATQPLRIRVAGPDTECVLHVARMGRDAARRVAGAPPAR